MASAIIREKYEPTGARGTRNHPLRRALPLPGLRTYLVVLGGCLVLLAANAVLHGLVASASMRINTLTSEVTTAAQEAQATELEIAYLSSYPRIAREAETRLAMRAPAPGEFRYIAMATPVPAAFTSQSPEPDYTGLVATLGGWLKDFGRAAANVR